MNEAQVNYIVTKKEFLLVVFGFEEFRPNLIGSHVIIFTNHVALKCLVEKKDAKPRLITGIMLLKELHYEIKDRKGFENPVVDHLSRIVIEDAKETPIVECFPDEQLLKAHLKPWFVNTVNHLVTEETPNNWTKHDGMHFLSIIKFFIWDDPYCLNTVKTKSLKDACSMTKSIMSSLFAMIMFVEGILMGGKPQRKFSKADFTNRPSLKLPMTIAKDIYVVNN